MPEAMQDVAPTPEAESVDQEPQRINEEPKPAEPTTEFKRLRGVYAALFFITAAVADLFSAVPLVGTIYINTARVVLFFMGIRAKSGKSILATQIGGSIAELIPVVSWLPMCLVFVAVVYIRGIIEERASQVISGR